MNRWWMVVLVLIPCLTGPVHAGIIFGKKTKPHPKERVPELIAVVKTDGDENKRVSAADELRQYDPAAFPEIVPVLIDVLNNDKKPSVRSEAATSLGKLRPVSQSAGLALEQAMAKDASMMVRLQARSALLTYRWAGYRSVKKEEPIMQNSKEPPLADPQEKSWSKILIRKTSQPRLTPQPDPVSNSIPRPITPAVITTIPGARPLPQGPANSPQFTEPPLAPPLAPVPPATARNGEGPTLE